VLFSFSHFSLLGQLRGVINVVRDDFVDNHDVVGHSGDGLQLLGGFGQRGLNGPAYL
jgi:hypothetical protein